MSDYTYEIATKTPPQAAHDFIQTNYSNLPQDVQVKIAATWVVAFASGVTNSEAKAQILANAIAEISGLVQRDDVNNIAANAFSKYNNSFDAD